MSQQLREFVKQSGVQVSQPTTASDNRGIPEFPPRLQKNIMSNENYGEFAEFVHMSNNENNTNEILANIGGIVVSKLNPGMFNATANPPSEFQTSINLKNILVKQPLPKTPIGEGLYIDTREINGIYGRFVTGFTHTREYGRKGDMNLDFFTVQLKLIVTNGTESKGATVNFYKNGKIRFSGGFIGTNITNQPELIRRFIVDNYSEKEAFLYSPFTYNNLSATFGVNGTIGELAPLATKLLSKYKVAYATFNPEISPFMYVTYNQHKFIFASSGNIQISGASSPSDLLNAYNSGAELVRKMYEQGDIKLGVTNKKIPKRLVKTPKTLSVNQRAALKIDGKQCMRLSKSELVDLAKRLGVVGITQSVKKQEICNKIKGISNTNTKTAKVNNMTLSGSKNTFKIGRKVCSGYSKTELLRVARLLNITLDPKETKSTLCKKIEAVRNAKLAPKPKTPPQPQLSRQNLSKQKELAKREQVMKKRSLNENSIRRDIINLYGKRWMNRYKNVMPSIDNDVKVVRAAINQYNKTNKLGLPFKKNIDLIKKEYVMTWKSQRGANLEVLVQRNELNRIKNQLNINNVPRNLVTQYRNSALNFIKTQKPTAKQLSSFKRTWLNLRMKR